MIINIFIFLILLLTSAFFSGIEIGFVSLPKSKILYKYVNGDKSAKILRFFSRKPHTFFSTILIGINIVSVTLATLFSHYLNDIGVNNFEIYTPLILFPIIAIFGESLPKLTFKKYNYLLVFKTSYLLWFFYIILYPFVGIFSFLSSLIYKLLGLESSNKDYESKELLIATYEAIKSYHDKKIVNFSEGFMTVLENNFEEYFIADNYPSFSLKNKPKELARILINNKLECAYIKRKGEIMGIKLKDLLFASDISSVLKYPFTAKSSENLGKTLINFLQSTKEILIIFNKNNEVRNIFDKNEFFLKLIKKK